MKFTRNSKKLKLIYAEAALAAGLMFWMIHPIVGNLKDKEIHYYEVSVNGQEVGAVADCADIEESVLNARARIAGEADDLVFMEVDYTAVPKNKLFGSADSLEKVEENIYQVLKKSTEKVKEKAYTVKINGFTVTLGSKEEVLELLEAAKNKYDVNNEFSIELVSDDSREMKVFTTEVHRLSKSSRGAAKVTAMPSINAGVGLITNEMSYALEETAEEPTFEEGIIDIDFEENVEIVESYVEPAQITPVSEAVDLVTKDKEKNKIYEVVSGDSLSVIAQKYETSVSNIVDMNENLESEESILQIGDELVVMVPEPELSLIVQEEVAYNEDYIEETQYIDNDSWYTTEKVTKQEGTVGNRDVVAVVTYRNGRETDREIVQQNVLVPSQPTIIERGTKTPPTYVKPISGGRFTSGFKFRWGRWHKGIDWACPTGTAVKASCAGVVTSAGWSSGYGYCVRIKHPDGRETRYAHLSKILVKTGQSVKQGEKIALSGNTGRSTGPHVHFEILINGTQVDPFKHLN